MTKTLPERPDLGQLKKQAKDLLRDIRAGRPEALARVDKSEVAGFSLHAAQRALAREYGFPSWAKLKLHVETRQLGVATARFVAAAANGDAAALKTMLAERPELARQTVSATAVLADLEGLELWVAKNPEFARAAGGVCETEALAYVCLGRLGGNEANRVACADFLLQHGANPNATWRESLEDESRLPLLYAATGRNNYPTLARRLLAAGANPNDGESIYHAAENNHVECLQALVDAGGNLSRRDEKWTNTPLYFLLGWSPGADRAATARAGILWLLDHGADPNVPAYQVAETPLFVAVRNDWDLELVRSFLDHGADPSARRADGKSVCSVAVRAGRADITALLTARGAVDDATLDERFLGALASGDAETARRALADHPVWRTQLAGEVTQLLFGAAKRGEVAVITLAASLGLDFDQPGKSGERALHWAAWHGQAAVVKQLIALGADLNKRESTYHAPPLGWCLHGSLVCRAKTGDYGAVAETLLAAGAEAPPLVEGDGSPEVRAAFARHSKR